MAQVNKYASTACPMFGPGKLVTDGEITRFDMYGQLYVGADTAGHDVKFFGATTGNYLLWDESLNCLDIVSNLGALAAEDHCIDLTASGTLASGGGLVGINVAVTTAGTAGSWVSGMYAKVTQGTTANVSGYISGAEFEIVNTCVTSGALFPLVLDFTDNRASAVGSVDAYIALRDYGTVDMRNLFWIADLSVGSSASTSMMTSVAGGFESTTTHAIRLIQGSTPTPYWIMVGDTAPS